MRYGLYWPTLLRFYGVNGQSLMRFGRSAITAILSGSKFRVNEAPGNENFLFKNSCCNEGFDIEMPHVMLDWINDWCQPYGILHGQLSILLM